MNTSQYLLVAIFNHKNISYSLYIIFALQIIKLHYNHNFHIQTAPRHLYLCWDNTLRNNLYNDWGSFVILSPFDIWYTSSDMGRYNIRLLLTLYHVFKAWLACKYTGPIMYFDRCVSGYVRPFWRVIDFDAAISSCKSKSKRRGNVSLSCKNGQTTAPAWSENINLASCELICTQVILESKFVD